MRLPKSGEFTLTRDVVIFVVGLLGIAHETVIVETERPFLLALFAAMIGLTGFLRAEDERKKRDDGSEINMNPFGNSNGRAEMWDEFLRTRRARDQEGE